MIDQSLAPVSYTLTLKPGSLESYHLHGSLSMEALSQANLLVVVPCQ